MCLAHIMRMNCFSKLLLKDQSRAFANVVFEWFGHKIVPKIGLNISFTNVDRWIEPIHRWMDWSLLYYKFI
jgi:hypothetical protein